MVTKKYEISLASTWRKQISQITNFRPQLQKINLFAATFSYS